MPVGIRQIRTPQIFTFQSTPNGQSFQIQTNGQIVGTIPYPSKSPLPYFKLFNLSYLSWNINVNMMNSVFVKQNQILQRFPQYPPIPVHSRNFVFIQTVEKFFQKLFYLKDLDLYVGIILDSSIGSVTVENK